MRLASTVSLFVVMVGCSAGADVSPGESVEQIASAYTIGDLRGWRGYYPMDRGQARGQRAGNPWMSALGQNGSIGAQLTWRLPSGIVGDPASGANRPNLAFPSSVAAWTPWYPTHQPEYYVNWWCRQPGQNGSSVPQVFDPAQHNCAVTNDYEELITEMPDYAGTAAGWLGLWGQGSHSSYTVNYDVSVCDMLGDPNRVAQVDAILPDPNSSRPLLFGLPKQNVSIIDAPAVCRVTFNNYAVRGRQYLIDYGKAYIATSVFSEFQSPHGYVIGALNYYYQGADGQTKQMPSCAPPATTDTSQGFLACVTLFEPYFMVYTGDPLVNGMTSWGQGYDSNGGFLNDVQWDTDKGWDGHQNSPPGPQFSFDTCSYGLFGSSAALFCH